MSDAAAKALAAALALTDAMSDAAARDDWATLATLDAQRLVLLQQACAQPHVDVDALAELRAGNDALIALVRARRERLTGEWQHSRKSQSALRNYQRVARDLGEL
ncbi:MAG: hypothetical protein COW59_04020 [Lysobacterales bacterium CG17_big_fil_post_rev_8_21_14_2_50_64_11]|nr:MAG: hypothetical protein COW59_04020 [Xanthomonadales bacterium CG17_big_fil_post_rev_8_21_14_2_50_64_11]PIX60155.1 MAG: hypothetical protein COZ47_08730 [Xanthomonadales bacterium CG_4_10_14_3_um_filter_64_11]